MRSCLLPSRFSFAVLALLVALAILPADTRAAPVQAGVVLKPGDFVIGSTTNVGVLLRTSDITTLLTSRPMPWEPQHVATGPNGEVYFADNRYSIDDFTQRPAIVQLNPATGAQTIIASGGFGSINSLTSEPNGALLVIDNQFSSEQILRLNPTNGDRSLVTRGNLLRTTRGLAVEADGSILTTADVSSGSGVRPRQIVRIRTGTGMQEVVSSGNLLVTPTYLAVGRDGAIFVSDRGGNITPNRVLRIHPQSGAQDIVTQPPNKSLEGITVDSSGQIFYIGAIDIFRVDPGTGQVQRVGGVTAMSPPTNIAAVKAASAVVVECTPRPPVSMQTSKLGSGRLQVTVKASGSGNTIRAIRPGSPPNAALDAQPTINGPEATFVLRRTGPGAVTLPFTVTDACGDWPTFVGGGPSAF